ncbi:ubiquitin-conjugating enzyme E2 W, partial [Pimephales promelas]
PFIVIVLKRAAWSKVSTYGHIVYHIERFFCFLTGNVHRRQYTCPSHVYSNGHICLSILTEDWSPALSVQSVCLSIISMLSSCKEKRRPPDNSFYVRTCNKNPKKTKWWYHDDTC